MNLIEYLNRQIPWSERTFGHSVRTVGITKHIEKELSEIRAAPHDLTEWVDVVILALDGAWRAGYTAEEIAAALERKQAVNMARQWPSACNRDPNEPSEHMRSPNVHADGSAVAGKVRRDVGQSHSVNAEQGMTSMSRQERKRRMRVSAGDSCVIALCPTLALSGQ